jgi:hypothetical protein|tara:strand:+ start:437 stop:1030 length:594 start_codon:yes stop_codon:yes gene_type:complete
MAEAPVDIRQLAGILGKSKSLLDKVDETFGKSGSGGEYSKSSMNENKQPPLPSGMVDSSQMLTSLPAGQTPQISSDPTQPIRRTLKNAKTTKMPKEIVEAMVNNPVADPASIGSMDGMDPELIKMINPNYQKESQKVIQESTPTQQNKTTSPSELKSLIREVVEEIIVERKVDEQLQIRVGDTIFTGKITKSKSINK